MLNQKNSIRAMLLGLLFLTIPNLVYANSDRVENQAEDRNILEVPIEFLYPASVAKLGFGLIPQRRERLYQKFKIKKRKKAQAMVDGANEIYKKSKINVKYVVHSVRFLDEDEASLYGVDDKGYCNLQDSLDLIKRNRGLSGELTVKQRIQGQENPKAIAVTALFCREKITAKRIFVEGFTKGITSFDLWTGYSMPRGSILIKYKTNGYATTLAHELGHLWGLNHVHSPDNEFEYTDVRKFHLLMNSIYFSLRKNTFAPEESAFINKRIKSYIERIKRYEGLSSHFQRVLNFLPGDYTKKLRVDDNIDDDIDDNIDDNNR